MALLPDFRAGDTVRIKLQYPSGTDLTGYRFWLTLKKDFADPDPGAMQVETTAGDHAEDDPENGIVYLVADPSDTDIPPDKYYWDIQAKSPGGEVTTLAPAPTDYKHRVNCVPGVTAAT